MAERKRLRGLNDGFSAFGEIFEVHSRHSLSSSKARNRSALSNAYTSIAFPWIMDD
jgi:hypothetical protein